MAGLRAALWHRCLRKGHLEFLLMTGFRSLPGIAVVLATPPFWLATAIIRVPRGVRFTLFSIASVVILYSRPMREEGSAPVFIQRTIVLICTFRSFAASSVERNGGKVL